MARSYKLDSTDKPAFTGASGITYADELNDQQLAAVASAPGPALVIAGAGSGKTRTLTYRVAYLLDQGIQARNILLLTFTNKASKEMLERVRELVTVDTSDLWGGTFHSIGNRILRRHADELGFTSSFSILDRDDQKSLMKGVLTELNLKVDAKRFPKADLLASIFSLSVNTGADLEQVLEESFPYHLEFHDEIEQVQEAYEAKKLDTNSMDFDDLLVKTVALLKESPTLRELYESRFQFVLVDEYQDTNRVQSEFIDLLVSRHQSLMVVGDDAQSIYSWRGADMDHILSFSERYPGAKTYKIETNYRSVPQILELSNAAIRANRYQFEKTLRPSRDLADDLPAVIALDDPSTQAMFVCQRIQELMDGGMEPEEIAVLYRAHYQSMDIQLELTQRGVPFQITSGLRFFEQAHVKDVSAYLRLVTNRRDEVSFKRIVLQMEGIGAKGADKLWSQWQKSAACRQELPEKFSTIIKEFSPPKKAQESWAQLGYTLDELVMDGELARPSDMIYSVLEGVYDEYLRANFDNYEQRRQDIEQLMMFSESFTDATEFLGQLSLLGNADGKEGRARQEEREPSVTLSSIHQAKGLEYKAVFVIWLTEGMFPNKKVLDSEDEHALEEERRLFYVAITRAKDELYLCYPRVNPKSYTGDFYQRPSRFLNDCPTHLVEEWEVG